MADVALLRRREWRFGPCALAPCGPAGLGWSISAHPAGVLIQAAGYSQRLPKLSIALAEALATFEPDPARFALLLAAALDERGIERAEVVVR